MRPPCFRALEYGEKRQFLTAGHDLALNHAMNVSLPPIRRRSSRRERAAHDVPTAFADGSKPYDPPRMSQMDRRKLWIRPFGARDSERYEGIRISTYALGNELAPPVRCAVRAFPRLAPECDGVHSRFISLDSRDASA